MPQIQYKDPESEKIVSIDIDAGMPVITIGRNPGNVIRVNNPSISRQHAKIVWEKNACTLIDLDSSNGSYVNGEQIKSQLLQVNDRLRVGEFALDFVENGVDAVENDVVGMSHEDIDIGDILSSADVDDALFNSVEPDSLSSISSLSSASSASSASDSPAPPVDSISFDSEFVEDEASIIEISVPEESDSEPVFVNDPDLSGSQATTNDANVIPPMPPVVSDVPVESGEAVAPSVAPALAFSPPPSPVIQVDNSEFELRITELTTERDELLDLLQSRAGDAGGAAKVQIDRLRAERDRLIEERRNLQRTQRDLRTQLEAFPPIDEMSALTEELETLRTKDANNETRVGSLQSDIDMHLETIEALNIKGHEQLTAIEQLENTLAENANLAQNLESAQQEIQNFDVVKNQLEEQITSLVNDGASFAERDQGLVTHIEQIENELVEKNDAILALENDKEELMKRSLALDELSKDYKAVQLELQARPVAEEVQTIIADLASARATIENNDQTIDELETNKTELNQLLETANVAQTQFDTRFDKQSEELSEVQRTYLALKKEKEAFARETDYLLGAKRNFDSEIRSAQKRVQELEKNDRRKKKIFEELRSDLEILIGENTILQTHIDGLQKQVDGSPTSDDLQASMSLSKERIEEIAGLKLTISDLEDELENQTKVAKAEVDKFQTASSKLKDSEIELEALRMVVSDESNSSDQNKELSKTIDANDKKIQDLTKDLESASAKITKGEDENDKLKKDNKKLKKDLTTVAKKEASKEKETQTKIGKLEKQIAETEEALTEIILAKDKLEDEIAASK